MTEPLQVDSMPERALMASTVGRLSRLTTLGKNLGDDELFNHLYGSYADPKLGSPEFVKEHLEELGDELRQVADLIKEGGREKLQAEFRRSFTFAAKRSIDNIQKTSKLGESYPVEMDALAEWASLPEVALSNAVKGYADLTRRVLESIASS